MVQVRTQRSVPALPALPSTGTWCSGWRRSQVLLSSLLSQTHSCHNWKGCQKTLYSSLVYKFSVKHKPLKPYRAGHTRAGWKWAACSNQSSVPEEESETRQTFPAIFSQLLPAQRFPLCLQFVVAFSSMNFSSWFLNPYKESPSQNIYIFHGEIPSFCFS